MKKFFQDFKKFIAKGNIFDMAVGLIIATAFNRIVSSLVNDIIMPLFTFLLGAKSLEDLRVVLRWKDGAPSLTWNYGVFLQAIINFLIIAFSLFLMVKIITNSRNKFKELNDKWKDASKKEIKAQKKRIKQQAKLEKRDFDEVWAEYLQKQAEIQAQMAQESATEQSAKEVVAVEKPKEQTELALLQEIRDILKAESQQKVVVDEEKE